MSVCQSVCLLQKPLSLSELLLSTNEPIDHWAIGHGANQPWSLSTLYWLSDLLSRHLSHFGLLFHVCSCFNPWHWQNPLFEKSEVNLGFSLILLSQNLTYGMIWKNGASRLKRIQMSIILCKSYNDKHGGQVNGNNCLKKLFFVENF